MVKKTLYTIGIGLMIASVFMFFNQAYATVVVVDSYSESNYDGSQISVGYNYSNKMLGQSFTSSTTVTLDSVKFYLTKRDDDTTLGGTITATIYAETHTIGYGTDSKPTGTALATSNSVAPSSVSLTPTFGLVTFNFSGANRISLTSGTNYVVVLDGTNLTGESNYKTLIIVGRDSTPSLTNGNGSFTSDGTTWSITTYDDVFYVYGDNGGGGTTVVNDANNFITF